MRSQRSLIYRPSLARKSARLLIPAGLALAALGAPQAASAKASLDYRCQFPVSGLGAAKIDLDVYTREVLFPGEPLPAARVEVAAVQTPLRAAALELLYPGIAAVEGTGRASFVVRQTNGSPLPIAVPLIVEDSAPGSTNTAVYGTGATPVLAPERGRATFHAGELSFNLRALDAAGNPVAYAGPDFDTDAWPDSDGNRATFDVRCAVDPATQETRVASVLVDNLVIEACSFGGNLCSTPEAPRHVRVGDLRTTSAEVRWTPADRTPYGDYGDFSYEVQFDGRTQRVGGDRFTLSGLQRATSYTGQVRAIFSGNSLPGAWAPFSFTTPPSDTADQTPPSTPTAVELPPEDVGDEFVNLRWGASTDGPGGSGVAEYLVQYRDTTIHVPATSTSTRIDGLTGPLAQVAVTAVDADGNRSQPLVLRPWGEIDGKRPTTPGPGDYTESDLTATSIRVKWTPSTQPNGPGIKEYRVRYNGAEVTVPAGQTQVLLTGLTPDTEYYVQVYAVDLDGLRSEANEISLFTLVDGPAAHSYAVKGSTSIKSIAKGTLNVAGTLDLVVTPSTAALSGDLALGDASGRLVAGGFLPVTAKIGFAPSGKTTGSVTAGVLKTTSKVRIKVKEVKLFGAIPLYAGNSCQTKSLTDLNLVSTQAAVDFGALAPLTGTYAISDLNGCGALNGLVSPLTAGGGNTISLTLAPKA